MTLEILGYSSFIFFSLFFLGTVLSLKIYKWDFDKFFKSKLWIKICYWIPIFLVFLAVVYFQFWAAVILVLLISVFAIRELSSQIRADLIALIYAILICFSSFHLALFFVVNDVNSSIRLLFLIVFSSVLSDICAYFFGNFLGRHKLPEWINKNKSWEGILGQIIGAILGFLIIIPIIYSKHYFILAAIIGIASATGDILNSIVKRRLRVIDWGKTIPGHGGVLDRMASLSLSLFVAFWWTFYFN